MVLIHRFTILIPEVVGTPEENSSAYSRLIPGSEVLIPVQEKGIFEQIRESARK
jgi:hypothetical protein